MKRYLAALVAGAFVAVTLPAERPITFGTQTVVVTPTDDARVSEAVPGGNYGNDSQLRVRASATPGGSYRSYLKFAISGLAGAPSSVRLRLYVTDASPDGGQLYGVGTNWTEGNITWASAPPITGNPIASLGAVSVGTWVEADITAAVSGNGTYAYAISNGVDNSALFSSSEGANPPQLVVVSDAAPAPPAANFIASPASGSWPLDVGFTDTSSGSPTSWQWDFDGDGSIDSTAQSPHHIYPTAGLFTVSLTVANGLGSDTETKADLVSVSAAPVLVGAGDIARCNSSGDEATAALLAGIGGTVIAVGDTAYENGSAADFANCYDPSWGQHRARTRPAPGNHEYQTPGASGYFGYFGTAAGDPAKGYYSYDLASWHIIVLNTECAAIGGCQAGSPQELWLRGDLAAHPSANVLAYMHHPRFSSGTTHGSHPFVAPLWTALYEAGADVVVSAHEHNYERFAPQTPNGTADASFGLREFVAGTGGSSHYPFGTPIGNSEVRNGTTYGVLKLTLNSASYNWQFVPVAGSTFTDSGTGAVHGPPPPTGPTITFTPSDDARVSQSSPTINAGSDTLLRVRHANSGSYASYLKFVVSGLTQTPLSARLRLWVTDGGPVGGSVFSVGNAWSESTITWANAPVISGSALGGLGAVASGTWVEIDLTAFITTNGTYSLGMTTTSGNSIWYSSSEGTRPPQLVISMPG